MTRKAPCTCGPDPFAPFCLGCKYNRECTRSARRRDEIARLRGVIHTLTQENAELRRKNRGDK